MTAWNSNGFPTDARSAAGVYSAKGLAPVPLPPRSKAPGFTGWQGFQYDADDADRHFPEGEPRNVGILNGTPSGGHVDVDLDCPEAVAAGSVLLPPTGWTFGRPSAPSSHRIYRTDVSLETASREFRDLDGSMLIELRGTGGLTVFPPSTHQETGEPIKWERFTAAGETQTDALLLAVQEVAAASLLARHWPQKGSRQGAAMALSGALIRGGWSPERVEVFVAAVAVAAGDEEGRKRAMTVAATAAKAEARAKTTGWPTLENLLGHQGGAVGQRVREWLRLAAEAVPPEVTHEARTWPEPPGDQAFHGIAGEVVRVIAPSSEADPAALLVQTLVAFGNVIGRGAYFPVEADLHHGNEFVVLVGRTSKARKGTSWGRVSGLFREVEEQWERQRVSSGLSSGEGLIWAVRDPIVKQERVKERGEEPRYEEVVADPGVEDKRLLVYEPGVR